MIKRHALLGIITALIVSIGTIGCSNGGTDEPTATPTTTSTEASEEMGRLPDSYKFFMTWNDSVGGYVEMQFWFKGDKWRTDYWSSSEEEFLIIYDGQFAYVYMPDAHMPEMAQVIKYSSPTQMGNPGAAHATKFEDNYYGNVSTATIIASFETACSDGVFTYGQEAINGQSCTKFTCNSSGFISSTWISDDGWLAKVERNTGSDYTYTMQYSNIELNADIDDSIFDINVVAPGAIIVEP